MQPPSRMRIHLRSIFVLLSLTAACGDNAVKADGGLKDGPSIDTPSTTVPTVVSTLPDGAATGVALNASVAITFSEPMDRATLTTTTFTLTSGSPPVTVAGTVIATGATAVLWPATQLASNVAYTATVSTTARSASHIALAAAHTWTFTTGTTVAPGLPVQLGTSRDFVILAKSGITTVPTSAVTGDLGASPIAATGISGFGLTADASNQFSTSPQVTGKIYAANYAAPTPAKLTTAVGDMELAYTDAAGRAPDVLNLGAGTLGAVTLAPGVYRWGTGLLIPTGVILSGSATSVWIFQISGNLTVAAAANITLAGGALASNVFWQVSGQVTAGAGAHLVGTLLCQTAITLDTGASLAGRLLAQTAATIRGATLVVPAP